MSLFLVLMRFVNIVLFSVFIFLLWMSLMFVMLLVILYFILFDMLGFFWFKCLFDGFNEGFGYC